jgi:hypothetical protein
MSARRLFVLAVVVVAVLGATPVAKPPARKAAYSSKLPAGDAHALARRSCLMCHSAMLITQQRKDSTAWRKSVRQMETWGVPLTPEESDSLVVYLSAHFGPRAR